VPLQSGVQFDPARGRVFVKILAISLEVSGTAGQAGNPALLGAFIIIVIEIGWSRRVVILEDALPDDLFDCAERGYCGRIRQPLHRGDAVFFKNALHAANGVTLAVEQTADAPQKIDIIGAIIAASAAPLHRFDLRKPRLPETQHVLGNIEVFGDLADGSERIRRLVQTLPSSFARSGERIELSALTFAVAGFVAIDSLFQDGRWFEHHHATRRDRHLGAGLRIAADPLSLLANHERAE